MTSSSPKDICVQTWSGESIVTAALSEFDAGKWNTLLNKLMTKSMPANLESYQNAFYSVMRYDFKAAALPNDIALDLQSLFRICHPISPRTLLATLCTVYARRDFEAFVKKNADDLLKRKDLKQFLTYFEYYMPFDKKSDEPMYWYAKALYTDLLKTLQQKESETTLDVLKARITRRIGKCLDIFGLD